MSVVQYILCRRLCSHSGPGQRDGCAGRNASCSTVLRTGVQPLKPVVGEENWLLKAGVWLHMSTVACSCPQTHTHSEFQMSAVAYACPQSHSHTVTATCTHSLSVCLCLCLSLSIYNNNNKLKINLSLAKPDWICFCLLLY